MSKAGHEVRVSEAARADGTWNMGFSAMSILAQRAAPE
jgi:hypothetical protein